MTAALDARGRTNIHHFNFPISGGYRLGRETEQDLDQEIEGHPPGTRMADGIGRIKASDVLA